MHASKTFPAITAVLLSATAAVAQSYSIPWHSIDGGGGTSTGGPFSMSGTIGQWDAGRQPMMGGGFSLTGGFWSIVAEESPNAPITIFDNSNGSFNGQSFATTTTWHAGKFCLGSQAYALDSVTLFLHSGDGSGKPHQSSVRLRIYSHDPVTGRPSADIGPIMDLAGTTNPITLAAGNVSTPFKWIPATPFNLAADGCYWVVVSVDSGANAFQTATFSMPTGDAATFGRSSSANGGASWVPPDGTSNWKMQILGTHSSSSTRLTISFNGADAAVVSWPFPSTGFTLQQNTGLNPANWTMPLESVTNDGTNRFILVNPPPGNRFYRLVKP